MRKIQLFRTVGVLCLSLCLCLCLAMAAVVLLWQRLGSVDTAGRDGYVDELLLDKREGEEEILKRIEREMPALDLDFMQRSRGTKLNESCAPYPTVHDIRFHNENWQTYEAGDLTLQLYGAYYDNRAAIPHAPLVRVLLMASRIGEEFPAAYCQLWFDEFAEPVIAPVAAFLSIWYREWGLCEGCLYPHLAHCSVPAPYESVVPRTVSLVAEPCARASNNLRVVYNRRAPSTESRGAFAICMKGMDFPFADMSARLVEWLELMRILGAEKVVTYELQVHPNVSKVLRHYEREGYVEVPRLTLARGEPGLPHFRHVAMREHYLNRVLNEPIPYNDCLYRNMYRYDYIAVVDLDEVIMPLGNLTSWHDLVAAIESGQPADCASSVVAFVFRNIYYPRYAEHGRHSPEVPDFMYMLQHVERVAEHLPEGMAIKCLHNTAHVVALHNHFPLHWSAGCDSVSVNVTLAQMQHYREPDVAADLLTPVVDDNIWRFKDALFNRSKTVLKQLGFWRRVEKVNTKELHWTRDL